MLRTLSVSYQPALWRGTGVSWCLSLQQPQVHWRQGSQLGRPGIKYEYPLGRGTATLRPRINTCGPRIAHNILLFCNSNNSLTQRVFTELEDSGHRVTVCENPTAATMIKVTDALKPDMIICPFLTKRIPKELYKPSARVEAPCLIVHPGIEGDRGMSSLDWAIKEGEAEWGVTVLQADDEMDAGDIYATSNFKINRWPTKSSLYQDEVTEAALKAVLEAVKAHENKVAPRPLSYENPNVRGRLRKTMTSKNREVNWSDTAELVVRTVRMSDTQPGATLTLTNGRRFLAYGAHLEYDRQLVEALADATEPGDILARRHGAVLFRAADGYGVWVSHMKSGPGNKALKLPAALVLPPELVMNVPTAPKRKLELDFGTEAHTFQEIWTTRQGSVVYVHFNFYNGAMGTNQCQRLVEVLQEVARDPCSNVVVLMGGHDYFSNGIHLNLIENAINPAHESWANINAINDVIREVFSMRHKVTIAAVKGNAGAGGAMMPLAADLVWTHGGVVINPHYKSMHLFGSEYWTYFLPQRVGRETAMEITNSCKPMLARKAVELGMYDQLLGNTKDEFNTILPLEAERLARSSVAREILGKKKERTNFQWLELLQHHRDNELSIMKDNFNDQSFHDARQKFVFH